MKKLYKEYKDKTVVVLSQEVQKLREDIAKSSLSFMVNKPKNTNELFNKRKKLAVLLTVLEQKKA